MIIRIALTFILFWAQSISFAASDESDLQLPLEAKKVLTRWNFKFHVFSISDYPAEILDLYKKSSDNQRPMKIVGDFNGDGEKDYVLLGEAEKQQYAVALVSDKKSFKAVVVKNWSDPDLKKTEIMASKENHIGIPIYLTVPKKTDEVATEFRKNAKTDIFGVEAYMGFSEYFSIKDFKPVKLNK